MSFTASLEDIVRENFNGLLGCPSRWARIPLGELTIIKNGIPLAASAFNASEGEPVVRIRNVVEGRTETFYRGSVEDDWFIEHGDLLIGMDGDFNAARWRGPRALLNQRVCMIKPRDGRVSVQYLAYVLPGYLAAINKHTPSITVKHLSSRTVAEVPVPVPPPREQAALLAVLEVQSSRIDSAVASLKRAKANVKRARASVLKAAVEGRLVPTEAALARDEGRDYEPASTLLTRTLTERRARWTERGGRGKYREPAGPEVDGQPELPPGWAWASADQVFAEICDGDHQPPPVVDHGVPFLVIGDVKSGIPRFDDCRFVSEEYYSKLDWKRRPDSNDILYTVVGSFGIPVDVPTDRPFCVQRHIAILKSPVKGMRRFLLRVLGSDFVFRQSTAKATGTAQKTLGLNRLREIVFPVPPLVEQERIVAEVDRRLSVLDALDATLDANLARCAKLRQSILKRAFEGKLVRPDASAPAVPHLPLFTEEAAP